jgi:hypothetical protein
MCPGPLIWFDAPPDAAILECATCGYIVITGTPNDARHTEAGLLREGLAQ